MDIDSDSDDDYDDDYNDRFERLFAMKPNNSGCTALHYACQYSSPEVVMEITRLHPYAVSIIDSEGLTTLHYACMSIRTSNSGPYDTFLKAMLLLQDDPSLIIKNQHFKSPITLYCEKNEMVVKELSNLLNGDKTSEETEVSLLAFWRVLILLISFATYDNEEKASEIKEQLLDPARVPTFSLLHPLLQLPIGNKPNSIIMDVMIAVVEIYPEQAQMVDMNGDLPIHCILAKNGYYCNDKLSLLIQALLSAYPHASRCAGSKGKLPFHLAVENGLKMNNGIKHIITAYPEVVGNFISNDERLFPFALSTVAGGFSPNLIFELLRTQPSLFRDAITTD